MKSATQKLSSAGLGMTALIVSTIADGRKPRESLIMDALIELYQRDELSRLAFGLLSKARLGTLRQVDANSLCMFDLPADEDAAPETLNSCQHAETCHKTES